MPIDLRSDTVTRPSPGMREAMARAEVGDDVYGEDPTVNRLEETIAARLGKEAAIFAPSGTQSNLLALLAHCQRGDEYIVGTTGHTYLYEGGGAAVLGSIQPAPLPFAADGTLPLDAVEAVIKPDDPHYARTRLLCLENTNDGRVLPLDYIADAAGLARRHGLGLHLDGARLFNAVVRLGVDASRVVEAFDTVSVCLSKGLGAPVGSCLVGSRELVASARRWRKMLGGGMRQAGVIAAAGLYALEHQVEDLARDHERAGRLATALDELDGVERFLPVDTNMVFVRCSDHERLAEHLAARDITVICEPAMRLVTHRDIDDEAIDRVIHAFRDFYPLRPGMVK